MINLGVLGSTNGTDLQPILDAIGAGRLDAKNKESLFETDVISIFLPFMGSWQLPMA